MTNKFKIATWHSGSANAHVAKDATSSSLLRRRSKLELAGAFLLVTVLAAATSGVRMSEASGGNTGNSPTKPVNLQVSQTDTSTPPTTDAQDTVGANTDVAANQTTTNDTGTTTQVTVNGQSMPVPANGSTQSTVTSSGQQTTVQISNNQTNTGNASSRESTHTNVHISSRTVDQEDSTTH